MNLEKAEHAVDFEQLVIWAESFALQFIEGSKGIKIAYRHFVQPDTQPSDKLVVLVNGRVENLLKWSYVAEKFYQQGYDVLVLDHRGQGYSERLLANPHKGYVDEFRFYADDLDKLIRQITSSHIYAEYFLLGHSMGSLISSYYLANYSHPFKKAVLSAPFWGVPSKNPLLDKLLVKFLIILGRQTMYIPHHGDYQPINAKANELCKNKVIIEWQNALIAKNPSLAVGGGTVGWINQCWQVIDDLPNFLSKIAIPVLVLKATEDQVVNNQRTHELALRIPKLTFHEVHNSKHEILYELPCIAFPVFEEIFTYFKA